MATTTYAPTSRRPIADLFRATAHGVTRWCVRRGIHPDAVSYGSIVASAGAAACFWQAGAVLWLLIPAVLLCGVRLYLNMLDGMVALESGKASRRGEIVNELPDRISDMLIFAGVAYSGLCNPHLALWAGMSALLTAYTGVLGQAVAGRREFAGLMSKPWRMAALSIGALATLAAGPITWLGLSLLDWTCAAIIAGCLQTCLVRLARTLRKVA
jgi:phosphatidylglycerophosphate synthase